MYRTLSCAPSQTCGKYQSRKYYDSDSGPGQQLHYQSSPRDLAVIEGQRNVNFSQNGELGRSCARVMKGRLY